MTDVSPDNLYTFAEAAEKLGRSEQSVRFLAKRDYIDTVNGMISKSALADFQERSVKASADVARAFKDAPLVRERIVRNHVLATSGVDSETATRLGYSPL